MTDSLIIDFHGPIAFRFTLDDALAYVPFCRSHRLNILTDTDDVGIRPDSHETFTLTGPDAGKTEVDGASVIRLEWAKDNDGTEPPIKKCYCIFHLPLPDFLFGLRPERVDLRKDTGGGFSDYYARGIRFWYNRCLNKPVIEPFKPARLGHLNARCLRPDEASYVKYRIEIRYYDINPVYDPELPHADAHECSQSMRNLFPPLGKWTADFEDPHKPESLLDELGTIPPVDCGANGLVFNDGGLMYNGG